ncbi:hypothetical protein BZG02_04495 [Labilibaculum filiforme]|uniref:DUF418 domain-containing protein n=1 Tax=Labilibaculum filiforme TaxID=1940526 RepID=A0A2N3I465_9BACT|nr:DUF418 domain-containing protein [Labilibaculum filiforme]PKQ65094.1 hypothetical protein BZG02_04495 [Labilibaculum filiforme]
MPNIQAIPTLPKERIHSLDVLRGFALLGILLINIQLFGLPNASFSNPSVMGELSASDYFSYYFVNVFGELKFMTIFSILFGAGIVLFINRLNERGLDGFKFQVRRMIFLLIFGMLHAYLIWFGDILVAYAVVGLIAVLLRKMPKNHKIILCVVLYLIPMAFFYLVGGLFESMPAEMAKEAMADFNPAPNAVAGEIDLYQTGTWFDIFVKRAQLNMNYQLGSFFMLSLWRTTGVMLLGMVLLNNGVLAAKKTKYFYFWMAVLGIGMGTFFAHEGFQHIVASKWEMIYFFKYGYQFNYFGSLFTALGYIGLILLIYQMKILRFFTKALEAVGRMAFTNYLCQSIICSIIFYSYGFGMFARYSRAELLIWVLIIWTFQLISSSIWLKYYKMGPFEWLWRYLTYKEKPQLSLNVKYQ